MDRKEKRKLRLTIMTKIHRIEMDSCEQCPHKTYLNRLHCPVCPSFKALSELGKELSAMSRRIDMVEGEEAYTDVVDVVRSEAGRKQISTDPKITEVRYLRAKARALSNQEIMDKYNISRSTLQKKANKWGHKSIKPAEARRLLNIKLGLGVK